LNPEINYRIFLLWKVKLAEILALIAVEIPIVLETRELKRKAGLVFLRNKE
jgi:hypothetical protein